VSPGITLATSLAGADHVTVTQVSHFDHDS
jgi:hypothetical protein